MRTPAAPMSRVAARGNEHTEADAGDDTAGHQGTHRPGGEEQPAAAQVRSRAARPATRSGKRRMPSRKQADEDEHRRQPPSRGSSLPTPRAYIRPCLTLRSWEPDVSRVGAAPAREARPSSRLALGYPGAREDHPWGDSVIKVRSKIFLFLGSGDGTLSLGVKLPRVAPDGAGATGTRPTPMRAGPGRVGVRAVRARRSLAHGRCCATGSTRATVPWLRRSVTRRSAGRRRMPDKATRRILPGGIRTRVLRCSAHDIRARFPGHLHHRRRVMPSRRLARSACRPANGIGQWTRKGRHASSVVIVGCGPAGLTAAIYAARANLEPLVIGGYVSGRPADDHERSRELPGLSRWRPRDRR